MTITAISPITCPACFVSRYCPTSTSLLCCQATTLRCSSASWHHLPARTAVCCTWVADFAICGCWQSSMKQIPVGLECKQRTMCSQPMLLLLLRAEILLKMSMLYDSMVEVTAHKKPGSFCEDQPLTHARSCSQVLLVRATIQKAHHNAWNPELPGAVEPRMDPTPHPLAWKIAFSRRTCHHRTV